MCHLNQLTTDDVTKEKEIITKLGAHFMRQTVKNIIVEPWIFALDVCLTRYVDIGAVCTFRDSWILQEYISALISNCIASCLKYNETNLLCIYMNCVTTYPQYKESVLYSSLNNNPISCNIRHVLRGWIRTIGHKQFLLLCFRKLSKWLNSFLCAENHKDLPKACI